MRIRTAVKTDLLDIFRLEQAMFGTHSYPDFFFRQALDLWPELLLVAKNDQGKVIGYGLAGMSSEQEQAWILSLAVADGHRGQGMGMGLLQRLIGTLEKAGRRHIRLTVHPDNPARHLYYAQGFEQVTAEVDYFGPGESRLVLLRQGHVQDLR